jgi:hypothetical protein
MYVFFRGVAVAPTRDFGVAALRRTWGGHCGKRPEYGRQKMAWSILVYNVGLSLDNIFAVGEML